MMRFTQGRRLNAGRVVDPATIEPLHFEPAHVDPPRFEPLEARTLMSGVTLITHGAQLTSSSRPAWLDAMASAIVSRTGPQTAVYALRIVRSGGTAVVQSFDLLSGSPPSNPANVNGETVIMLDWADASGVIFSFTNASVIAGLVAPFLTNAVPNRGIDRPLAESPIHLVGHSRGGSVVSQLAMQLGRQGIWVDQVTMLDPHPVSPDPDAVLFQNVVYGDNYYQLEDAFITGEPVPGSYEINLSPVVPSHTNIHTWYHGTIDTQTSGPVDGVSIPSSWYTSTNPLTGPRNQIGYRYSRVGGGDRFTGPAAAGLHPVFGISAAPRVALDLTNANWPSLVALGVNDADLTYALGEEIHPVALYADVDSGATITYHLDADINAFNANDIALGQSAAAQTGGGTALAQGAFSTAGAAPGTYRLRARITDAGGRSRFIYSAATITLIAPPPAVASVSLDSTAWQAAFPLSEFAVPQGAEQLDALPWTNLDQVRVTFNKHVIVASDDLSLRGVSVADYEISGFVYNAATFTATWTLAAPIAGDKLLIDLAASIADSAGSLLDGDWSNGADAFPSGDGAAGGAFRFRVNVLPGDASRSGAVLVDDVIRVRNAQFKPAGSAGYSAMLDLDGSGAIATSDVALVRARQFTTLPANDPVPGGAGGSAMQPESVPEPPPLALAATTAQRPAPAARSIADLQHLLVPRASHTKRIDPTAFPAAQRGAPWTRSPGFDQVSAFWRFAPLPRAASHSDEDQLGALGFEPRTEGL